jgi:hypothetical protein
MMLHQLYEGEAVDDISLSLVQVCLVKILAEIDPTNTAILLSNKFPARPALS